MNKQSNWIILIVIILGATALGYNTWYKQQLQQDTVTAGTTHAIDNQISGALTGQQRPDFTLKDMSLDGTYVNNRRIEQTKLRNNQKIKMGNTQLEYHEKR